MAAIQKEPRSFATAPLPIQVAYITHARTFFSDAKFAPATWCQVQSVADHLNRLRAESTQWSDYLCVQKYLSAFPKAIAHGVAPDIPPAERSVQATLWRVHALRELNEAKTDKPEAWDNASMDRAQRLARAEATRETAAAAAPAPTATRVRRSRGGRGTKRSFPEPQPSAQASPPPPHPHLRRGRPRRLPRRPQRRLLTDFNAACVAEQKVGD
jgi:hypothetical protein